MTDTAKEMTSSVLFNVNQGRRRDLLRQTDPTCQKQKNRPHFRIGELNPGLVGTDHREMIESDKS
jgi:hypothetical protein